MKQDVIYFYLSWKNWKKNFNILYFSIFYFNNILYNII